MCTCLLPRKPSWGGLFTSARTWPVHYSMLGAQQMYAPGGPAPRRPAWTKTTPTLAFTSILCLVVQVGQVTCHTSGGHLLTLWTLQWSSWREQDTRGEQSVGVMNVKNWKNKKISGSAAWALFMVEMGSIRGTKLRPGLESTLLDPEENLQKFNFVSICFLYHVAMLIL